MIYSNGPLNVLWDTDLTPLKGCVQFLDWDSTNEKAIYSQDGSVAISNPRFVGSGVLDQPVLLKDGSYKVIEWRYLGNGTMSADWSDPEVRALNFQMVRMYRADGDAKASASSVSGVYTVDSVAALAAIDDEAVTRVLAIGYASAGDSPARMYYRVTGSHSADGGSVIASSGITGAYWLLCHGLSVDASVFGILPKTATDDFTAQLANLCAFCRSSLITEVCFSGTVPLRFASSALDFGTQCRVVSTCQLKGIGENATAVTCASAQLTGYVNCTLTASGVVWFGELHAGSANVSGDADVNGNASAKSVISKGTPADEPTAASSGSTVGGGFNAVNSLGKVVAHLSAKGLFLFLDGFATSIKKEADGFVERIREIVCYALSAESVSVSGGVSAESVDVSGGLSAESADVSGNVTAGSLAAPSMDITYKVMQAVASGTPSLVNDKSLTDIGEILPKNATTGNIFFIPSEFTADKFAIIGHGDNYGIYSRITVVNNKETSVTLIGDGMSSSDPEVSVPSGGACDFLKIISAEASDGWIPVV